MLAASFDKQLDDYHAIMAKALADRLAEAFTESLHERVRRAWYAPDEALTRDEIIAEKYRGIRPAFGYPACPDHTEKRSYSALAGRHDRCDADRARRDAARGQRGRSVPRPPAAPYFAVGRIGRDQVEDYARRKRWVSRRRSGGWAQPLTIRSHLRTPTCAERDAPRARASPPVAYGLPCVVGSPRVTTTTPREPQLATKTPRSRPELLVRMHELMVRARCLEERLIRMNKQGDGYFWIGGPGEEAFNVPLGLLVHKGQGPQYDYLHLHYRSSATLLAMGADPVDALRQMKNTATDPYSARPQLLQPLLGAEVERRARVARPSRCSSRWRRARRSPTSAPGGKGITIVQGGDAGTAEGDFATCLVWCSRPGNELPCLMIVTNNQWGISTPASEQHGEKHIADRGKAVRHQAPRSSTATIPRSSTASSRRRWTTCAPSGSPFLLEAMVSRLYGHSSASGANFVTDEVDCLAALREEARGAQDPHARGDGRAARAHARRSCSRRASACARSRSRRASSIWKHVFAERDLVHDALGAAPTPRRTGPD